MSEAMGRNEPMIIKYVNELCAAGYLVHRKRFTKTNLYIMWLPIITSIEELVVNYRCFACPLTADDFDVGGDISREDLENFFEIVKSLKQQYWDSLESGGRKTKYDEIEKLALEEYQSRKASKD